MVEVNVGTALVALWILRWLHSWLLSVSYVCGSVQLVAQNSSVRKVTSNKPQIISVIRKPADWVDRVREMKFNSASSSSLDFRGSLGRGPESKDL